MKSSREELQKRGYADERAIAALRGLPQEELLYLLHSDNAVVRTAAACTLSPLTEVSAQELLKQLTVERCLYTRLAIGESLEQGDENTARHMCRYLGKLGDNQYRTAPERVSAKKSYPLPRDIIARSLGKMSPRILPVLLEVLACGELPKISEALDAIGFLVFYHSELGRREHVEAVLRTADRYRENDLILWKALLCLSSFSQPESRAFLSAYDQQRDILDETARRSVRLIEARCRPTHFTIRIVPSLRAGVTDFPAL